MKKMLVRVADKNGKLGDKYIIIKSDFRLATESCIKYAALLLSSIGICSIIYWLSR